MARPHTKFVCQQCGYESAKWMGRCPDCGEWNSLVETVIPGARGQADSRVTSLARAGRSAPTPLTQIEATGDRRLATGSGELDRVLGGGVAPGSLVLLGGGPGIRQSTPLAPVPGRLDSHDRPGPYVSD